MNIELVSSGSDSSIQYCVYTVVLGCVVFVPRCSVRSVMLAKFLLFGGCVIKTGVF